jgi:hypothetical protein
MIWILQLTHHPPCHPIQGYLQSQDHNSHSYWSSSWLGSRWTFATMSSHIDNETFSFYNCLNGLFDDTIDDTCHQVHTYATSNESFIYSQMLREEDHKQFFKTIEIELADHEPCNH